MPADLEHHAPVLNATRARQGRYGRHIFWVLVISTVLAAAALFGAWGMRSGDLSSAERNNGASTTQEAQHYSADDTKAKPAS